MPQSDADPHDRLKIGIFIVAVTATVQGVILFGNSTYALHTFGAPFLIIYLAAASCYIAWPWIGDFVDDFAHSGAIRVGLFAFCLWITFEEHVHAAQHFKAPEGLTGFWSFFFEHDSAKLISLGIIVAALLGVVELMHHLQHHGASLIKGAHKDIKSS
jgi:hypothetical protein